MHDGQIVYAKSCGYADTATGMPIRPELRFDLASISKQFLAAAVLMLVDQGRLGLDDRIATWLGSDGPPGWNDITIRQALSHTAGLPGLPDDAFFNGIEARSDIFTMASPKKWSAGRPSGQNRLRRERGASGLGVQMQTPHSRTPMRLHIIAETVADNRRAVSTLQDQVQHSPATRAADTLGND